MILNPMQVEILIKKSIDSGQFDNLKGMGVPLNLDFKETAENSFLKRCGITPREVSLLKELWQLSNLSENAKKIIELKVEIDILREQRALR